VVSAAIDTFGVYALMAEDVHPPHVISITRADPSPTSAASINFTVLFSETVTDVDANDFKLATKGISGASISGVSGSNNVYTVTVNKGKGSGTLVLNLVDDDSIVDGAGNHLGGTGTGNGSFVGAVYVVYMASQFPSTAINDGWVLESNEFSNTAATRSNKGFLRVGDDARNKQYRSILSFDTAKLPDKAVITKATLRVKKAGMTGDISMLGDFVADMRKGSFGLASLQPGDFKTAASSNAAGRFRLDGDWYQLMLNPRYFKYIHLAGATQFRLRFIKDDDNDRKMDFLSLYAGDAAQADQPQLVIEYYVP
jgi:hypothetical protein